MTTATSLPDLTREAWLAMLSSPDSPATLEWKMSPTGVIDADDDGLVTAIVAVTGIVDEVDDIIIPGAFKRTLTKRTPKGVWSHDVHTWVARTEAIGELAPGDSRLPSQWKGKPWPREAGALVVQTRFNLGTTAGRDAYSNVKFFDAGPLGPQVEWSIGYNSIPGFARRNRLGQRELSDIDLYEYCPVLFGAMPLAGTVGTKARTLALEHKGGPFMGQSTIIGNLELKVAGKEATPKDVANTERLKQYWEHGEGAAKIRWGVPGDFDRCVRELSKYMPPGQVKGYCANRHKGATGGWPGHAPGVESAEAAAKKAEHKSADLDAEDAAAALLDGLEGKADKPKGSMPDGSFPITDGTSLKKAIKAHARAKDPEKAKAHIKRRAKAIGCEHMIPDQWTGTKGAVDTLESDTDTDDGGLAGAVEALEAFEALGMTDDEIDAALADDPEWSSLPDTFPPAVEDAAPPAGGDTPPAPVEDLSPDDGDAPGDELDDLLGGVEHKMSKAASALTAGDVVIELKGHSGVVAAVAARAGTVGVRIGTEPVVWVPPATPVEVKWDPYAELKEGLALVAERKDFPNLPGSVEERQREIEEAVRDLLLPEPDDNGNVRAYVSLIGTFADYVVVNLCDYSQGNTEEQAFAIPYSVDAGGSVTLGQPAPVERQVSIVPASPEEVAEDSDRPMGGMDPTVTIARKLYDGAKALLEAVEAKAATGDLDGLHLRRVRSADEAMTGALAGFGQAIDVLDPDESKALLGEVAELFTRAAEL